MGAAMFCLAWMRSAELYRVASGFLARPVERKCYSVEPVDSPRSVVKEIVYSRSLVRNSVNKPNWNEPWNEWIHSRNTCIKHTFIGKRPFPVPRSGVLRAQKLKTHLLKTQNPKVLPSFRSIHRHFFQNLSRVFPVLAAAHTCSCVGPQNKIGHPAHCYRQLVRVPLLNVRGILIDLMTYAAVFLGLRSEIVDIMWVVVSEKKRLVV